jgi:hypothetical protein
MIDSNIIQYKKIIDDISKAYTNLLMTSISVPVQSKEYYEAVLNYYWGKIHEIIMSKQHTMGEIQELHTYLLNTYLSNPYLSTCDLELKKTPMQCIENKVNSRFEILDIEDN